MRLVLRAAAVGDLDELPLVGTGKPEPLGGNLPGWWSRRINRKHRLVNRVTGKGEAQALGVAGCRYWYWVKLLK